MSSDPPEVAEIALDGECSFVSRRDFVARSGLAGLALVFVPLRSVVRERGWIAGDSTGSSLVRESLDGLAAYVVPGTDAFSVAQGVTASGPGAVAARATDGFIDVVDALAPVTAPGNSATVAAVLNALAGQLHPRNSRSGFRSQFAGLSFENARCSPDSSGTHRRRCGTSPRSRPR